MESNKTKETLKQKWVRIRDKIKYPLLLLIAIVPILGMFQHYYSLGFPMLNMWDLLVQYLFGSFWVAVAFLMLLFFLILMLGGISYYTILIFLMYFVLAMTIGYGYSLITVLVAAFATLYVVYQTFKLLENR